MNAFKLLILTTLLLTSTVNAQVFNKTREYFEDASRLYAQGDKEAAVIQLRNGLQLHSDHVPSLVLLGKIQLELRNSGESIQMLEDALLLGADPVTVVEPLAEGYLQRGEYSRLMLQLPLEQMTDTSLPVLLAAHAEANMALGRIPDAEALIERGTARFPTSPDIRLARLTLLLRQGNFVEAETLAEQLVAERPEDTRSWNAWASVRHVRADTSSAIQGYRKAIELEPYNASARIALISLLFDIGDKTAAAQLVAWMRINIPQDPRGAYFAALIAASDGDRDTESAELAKAAEIFNAISSERFAADPQMQMMGGLTYYSLGAYEKARGLVAQYLNAHERDKGAARLLASILVAMGEPDEAVQVLRPHHRRSPDDEATTISLATALNASGRPLQAARLLEELGDTRIGERQTDKRLALALLDAGDSQTGTALLEKVLSKPDVSDDESLLLTLAYLRSGAWSDAMTQLDRLKAKNPDNPLLDNLRAIALSGDKRPAEAIEVLRKLSQNSPDFYPAWTNLARLLRDSGNLPEARVALESARQIAPDDPRLDYEMALQLLAEGELAEALRYSERASISEPTTLDFASLEVEIQFALGNADPALDAALRAAAHEKAPAATRRLLASAQARSGDREQALLTLKRAARAADFDAAELTAIAEQQILLADYVAAAGTLAAALKGDADYTPAQRAQVQVEIGLKNYDEALQKSEELLERHPEDPVNHMLYAEASMAADDFVAALKAFGRARQLNAGEISVIGQIDALQALTRYEEAKTLMADYIGAGGRNAEIRGRYADTLIQEQDWEGALPILLDMAEEFSNVPSVLNNLAVVQHQLGRSEALNSARKALVLDKTNPYSNDTLGWILLSSGDAQEALGFLREATARAARNPELRYHLGAALHALGRNTEARQELEQALASAEMFRERPDALALLNKIRLASSESTE